MDLRGHGDVRPSLRRAAALAVAAIVVAAAPFAAMADPIRVGSKRFTESYILGEILVQSAERDGVAAAHRPGLGNTAILYEALTRGSIDAYPEYTGTIAREILKAGENLDLAAINRRLAPLGLAASTPLGFSNGYALGLRAQDAAAKSIASISDLAKNPAQIGRASCRERVYSSV